MHVPLATLRTELADLAFELERLGRHDAADVVMMLDVRVRELAGDRTTTEEGTDPNLPCPSGLAKSFP